MVKKAKKTKKKTSTTTPDEDSELDSRVDESLQLSKSLGSHNWREMILNHTFEDSDYAALLDECEWNVFWRGNTVLVSPARRQRRIHTT